MSQPSAPKSTRRVAVVGGGISGIGSMWGLAHEDCEVHLFESDSRLGGHANTVMFDGCGISVPVDTGFIAMKEKTYPEFTAFLQALNVETVPSDMSFAVSEADGSIEWASTSAWTFVGRFSNLFRPWFWRLVFDVIRFNYFATDLLSQTRNSFNYRHHESLFYDEKVDRKTPWRHEQLESIGAYLDREGYSEQFKRYFIIPMVAAPWCIDQTEFYNTFPAVTLVGFMAKQGILDTITQRLRCRTIRNGSKSYVDAFLRSMPSNHSVHLNATIRRCVRQEDGRVSLEVLDRPTEVFDHVILAVPANEALTVLEEGATAMEREILCQFKTSESVCVLHSDMSLMPRRPNARASWNCLMESESESSRAEKISVTFDMNRLQGIPLPGEPNSPGRVLVSMNSIHPPSTVKGTYHYKHPLHTSASVLALENLDILNSVGNVSFAGAWMGYGFHEDGFAAGLQAARNLLKGTKAYSRNHYNGIGTEVWTARSHLIYDGSIYSDEISIDKPRSPRPEFLVRSQYWFTSYINEELDPLCA